MFCIIFADDLSGLLGCIACSLIVCRCCNGACKTQPDAQRLPSVALLRAFVALELTACIVGGLMLALFILLPNEEDGAAEDADRDAEAEGDNPDPAVFAMVQSFGLLLQAVAVVLRGLMAQKVRATTVAWQAQLQVGSGGDTGDVSVAAAVTGGGGGGGSIYAASAPVASAAPVAATPENLQSRLMAGQPSDL